MGEVEVLISAMHQNDLSIIDNTGIHSNVLMINQCDENKLIEENRDFGKVRCISTTERGLSKSRNMALKNAVGKYCLICDDDETLFDNYAQSIEEAFESNPKADILAFQIKRKGKKYKGKAFRIRYLSSLKIASWQIAFRRNSIKKAGILFDEELGSGTPTGSGEENMFLFDCLKAGLRVQYVPICIGIVQQEKSNWFNGFTAEYFYNKGLITRKLMGRLIGYFYMVYFITTKYRLYHKSISLLEAAKQMIKGLRSI